VTLRSRRAFIGIAGTAVAGAAAFGDLYAQRRAAHSEASTEILDGVGDPRFRELAPFKDPLRIPAILEPSADRMNDVDMVNATIRLHSQLPPTHMWTYAGHFPGPTITVAKGVRYRIAWNNRLTGTSPVKAVWVDPEGPFPGRLPYNVPGSNSGRSRPEVDALTAWTTVHLHGGQQSGIYDGATDCGVATGETQLAEYLHDFSAHLFYHDHAMAVTALNVSSGLVGNVVIADDQANLGLPQGRYEIPLMISDVNFETDTFGRLTGQLLVKRVLLGQDAYRNSQTTPRSIPFFGPFTMVNGVVWPHLDVEARSYRFRFVNASAARAYRLVVVDAETGMPVRGAMTLVGTDLGLLGEPRPIDEALSLSTAERADIVIDFAAHPGRRLNLINTVAGQPVGSVAPLALIAHPEIMQFRVEDTGRPSTRTAMPARLASDFHRLVAADVPQATVERVVVTGYDRSGLMPQLWEMKEVVAAPATGGTTVQLIDGTKSRTFRRVATTFEDTTTFFATADTWEKWTFINLVPPGSPPIDHPMHIHLMSFQIIDRRSVDVTAVNVSADRATIPITVGQPLAILPEESGWKDTVTVHANTLVTVAGRIAGKTGKVVYHCHFLDHEDEGMMRPLVVMPAAIRTIHSMLMNMMDDDASTM